jgi:hypothetical protein
MMVGPYICLYILYCIYIYLFRFFLKGNVLFDILMELLSQFLYSENIFSTVIGSHLENSRHFENKNRWLTGYIKQEP